MTTVEEEIDQILELQKLRDVTKKLYRRKMLQLANTSISSKYKRLRFFNYNVNNVIKF